MDAFELLKNDHKKVSKLFNEIELASGQAKEQLFTQLKNELDVHAHIEERFLYPALENTEEAREITLEAYEEHKVVKDLLAELSDGGTPIEQWDAKLTVLKENVEHHVEEEEGELFDKAEDVLGDDRIEQLGSQMEAEKSRMNGSTPTAARAPRPARQRASKQKAEKPGVLQRLASLVGLGDSDSGKTSRRKAATSPSAARKSTSKRSNKPTKAARKASGKTKAAGKARSGSKSKATAKASARVSAGRGRSAAKKAPPRKAASKRGTRASTTRRTTR